VRTKKNSDVKPLGILNRAKFALRLKRTLRLQRMRASLEESLRGPRFWRDTRMGCEKDFDSVSGTLRIAACRAGKMKSGGS